MCTQSGASTDCHYPTWTCHTQSRRRPHYCAQTGANLECQNHCLSSVSQSPKIYRPYLVGDIYISILYKDPAPRHYSASRNPSLFLFARTSILITFSFLFTTTALQTSSRLQFVVTVCLCISFRLVSSFHLLLFTSLHFTIGPHDWKGNQSRTSPLLGSSGWSDLGLWSDYRH